jgi:hypothetical protein
VIREKCRICSPDDRPESQNSLAVWPAKDDLAQVPFGESRNLRTQIGKWRCNSVESAERRRKLFPERQNEEEPGIWRANANRVRNGTKLFGEHIEWGNQIAEADVSGFARGQFAEDGPVPWKLWSYDQFMRQFLNGRLRFHVRSDSLSGNQLIFCL